LRSRQRSPSGAEPILKIPAFAIRRRRVRRSVSESQLQSLDEKVLARVPGHQRRQLQIGGASGRRNALERVTSATDRRLRRRGASRLSDKHRWNDREEREWNEKTHWLHLCKLTSTR
jgi:hypothetical protein